MILAWEKEDEYGDLLRSIQGCVFLGVPHRGADLAYWADFPAKLLRYGLVGFGGNTAYLDALRKDSQTLRDISEQFVKRVASIKIRTFYETEKLGNMLIVDEYSARLNLPNERAIGVAGSNHRTMCKFNEAGSQRYEPVWRAIKKLAQDAIGASSSSPVSLSEDETRCLQSLYTSDYQQHRGRNPDRVLGTCEWFLGHHRYLEWRRAKNSSLLWVSADPGCGKSVLAKFLIDELNGHESQTIIPGTVCFFFFKDDNDEQKSATFALCAILHQLFTTKSSLVAYAMPEFRSKAQKFTEEFETLWSILTTAIIDRCCGNVVCVIDGLDECEGSTRDLLIKSLVKFYSGPRIQGEHNFLKFIVTSRPYISIEDQFYDLPAIRLRGEDETDSTSRDIEQVVRAKVKTFGEKRRLSKEVQNTLVDRLIGSADRTFLWVSLVLKMIENSVRVSRGALDDIIGTMPPTLDAVYDKILLQSTNSEDARRLLHIVVAAARPLSIEEMGVAFVIRSSDKSYEDLDSEPSIGDTIRNLCGLFVRVVDSNIYLVHQTAKEFLVNNSAIANHSSRMWKNSLHPVESNFILAERCIWYLLFSTFEDQPLAIDILARWAISRRHADRYVRGHRFLDYAARHWADHFRKARVGEETVLSKLAEDVCDARSRRLLTWFQVKWGGDHYDMLLPQRFTNLALRSYLGHDAAVGWLIERGADVAEKDERGRTALHWAAMGGQEAVVCLLVGKGANIAEKDPAGLTALHHAVVRGHGEVARLLLEKEADIAMKDRGGTTPLHWAAMYGHKKIVRLLLEEGANTAERDQDEQTALHWAAMNGHKDIVQLLLENGANIAGRNRNRQTALHLAARNGQDAVVRFMLEKGANIADKDQSGRTALHYATTVNYKVVQTLLEKGADIAEKDQDGLTALHSAVKSGRESAVRLLLDEGAGIAEKSEPGLTALNLAAMNGHKELVQLLLERGASFAEKDQNGLAVLTDAVKGGHEGVVELLLKKGVNIDHHDQGRLAAWYLAAKLGHTEAVQLLLKEGEGIAKEDSDERTALYWAAIGGHTEVVRILLEKGADTAARDYSGSTVLHQAALHGHEAIVQLLLENGADPTAGDANGLTALDIAITESRDAVVQLLVPLTPPS